MKKIFHIVVLFFIYFGALGIRVYWFSQKDGFHLDEALSVSLAGYNDYMWTENYPFNEIYSGKQIKEMSLCDNDSLKNILGNIYSLWKDNRDRPHTNFYYSLLRISLAGLKTGNIKTIIFRGGFLNLLLFTISFFMFFALMTSLFKDNKLIPYIAVFCTFLSTATISNTLFLRPYQLQETMFIVFVYFFIRFIGKQKFIVADDKLYLNFSLVSLMSFITALTLLTGYYAIFFIAQFGLYIIYHNQRQRNIKEIFVYAIILLYALILAQFFYSRYLMGFLSGRAQETAQTIFSNGFIQNIKRSFITVIDLLGRHYFIIPITITSILIIIYLVLSKNRLVFPKYIVCIFIIAIVYMFIVTYVAPYKDLRYSMAIFPFFVMLPMVLLYSIRNKTIYYIALILFCISFAMNIFNVKNIENIFKNKSEQYLFAQDSGVSVLVINKTNWKYADIVPYFNDNQSYVFNANFNDFIMLDKYTDFYLIVEKDLESSITIDPRCFLIESAFDISYFSCKKIKAAY